MYLIYIYIYPIYIYLKYKLNKNCWDRWEALFSCNKRIKKHKKRHPCLQFH